MTEHISPATNSAFPLDDNAGTFTLLHPSSLSSSFSSSLSLSLFLSIYPQGGPAASQETRSYFYQRKGASVADDKSFEGSTYCIHPSEAASSRGTK